MTTTTTTEPSPGTPPRPPGGATVSASLAWVVALEAVEHPHLARVVDLVDGGAPGRVDVLLEPGPRPSLDAWLVERERIDPGEAVTVLVPVLVAVVHLLRRGVVVTALDAEGVVLDDRGAPVVVVAEVRAHDGDATTVAATSPSPCGATAGVGVLALVTRVLAHAGTELPPGPGPTSGVAALHSLVERVHDLAPALPLATPSASGSACPPRDGGADATGRAGAPDEVRDGAPSPGWLAVLPESDVVLRLEAWWRRGGLRTVPAAVRGVRPRAWLLVAAVVLALGAATVVLGPADTTPDGTTAPADAGGGRQADDPDDPDDPDVAGAPDASDVGDVADGADVGGPPSPGEEAGAVVDRALTDVVSGEDPAAAGRALLDGRDSCLRDLLAGCLREVDQAGSPLLAADLAAVAEPAGGTATPATCTGVDEADRWGGTALLTCARAGTTAASVLVVRTEAGWRLREVVTSGEEG